MNHYTVPEAVEGVPVPVLPVEAVVLPEELLPEGSEQDRNITVISAITR